MSSAMQTKPCEINPLKYLCEFIELTVKPNESEPSWQIPNR